MMMMMLMIIIMIMIITKKNKIGHLYCTAAMILYK